MDPETVSFLRIGIIQYIILASSIALHECGHAFSADRLGDRLPRMQGRVTLNPLAHLDPIGTGLIPLLMIFSPLIFGGGAPIALIGWGRPVQINLMSFHPKDRTRNHLLVTTAGPAVNFVIALAAAIVGGVLAHLNPEIVLLFWQIITLNVALIVFNLIPIPPLDGSHFLRYATGMSEETFFRLASWGIFILLFLVNFGPTRALMGTLIHWGRLPFGILMGVIDSIF